MFGAAAEHQAGGEPRRLEGGRRSVRMRTRRPPGSMHALPVHETRRVQALAALRSRAPAGGGAAAEPPFPTAAIAAAPLAVVMLGLFAPLLLLNWVATGRGSSWEPLEGGQERVARLQAAQRFWMCIQRWQSTMQRAMEGSHASSSERHPGSRDGSENLAARPAPALESICAAIKDLPLPSYEHSLAQASADSAIGFRQACSSVSSTSRAHPDDGQPRCLPG